MGPSARIRHYMMDNRPLILDGGLSTDLEAHGVSLQGDPLWSSRLLHSNPQVVKDGHYRFLLSGADVITTATYQGSIPGFVDHLGVTSEHARELFMSGVHLAKEAVERFVSECRPAGANTRQRCPLVAGSIGPYGAFLHNGSEYTGAYAEHMNVEELKDWHRQQVECVVAAGADFIAFETIPSMKEAEAVVELLREFPDSKAWLSFSCKDEKCISDGNLFADAVRLATRSPQLVAVGINCCSPLLVEPLLDSAGSVLGPDLTWVVYPNSGETWDTKQGWLRSDQKSELVLKLCHTWKKQGAALIGGCCRISPAHIAELRQQLSQAAPAV